MKHYFYIYRCRQDVLSRSIVAYWDRDYNTFARKVIAANTESFRCSPLRIKRIL